MIPVADISQRVKPRVGSLWAAQAFDDTTFIAALNDSLADLSHAYVFPANERSVTITVTTPSGTVAETTMDECVQALWVKKDGVEIDKELILEKKEFFRQSDKKGVGIGFDKFWCAESGTYEIYGNFYPIRITSITGAQIDLPYNLCLNYLVERCVYYYLTWNLKLTQAAAVNQTCSYILERMGASSYDRIPEKKSITSSDLA